MASVISTASDDYGVTVNLDYCTEQHRTGECITNLANKAVDEQLYVSQDCFQLYPAGPEKCLNDCLELSYSFDCNPLYVCSKLDYNVELPYEPNCAITSPSC